MGLQQFERRLERMVESVFARAFRSSLQPVEIGRRLTREMDLRRTVAPKGTLAPNDFVVLLSPADKARFASIEEELIDELKAVAIEHAKLERYSFIGPVEIVIEADEEVAPGTVFVSGEMHKGTGSAKPRLVLPDGRKVALDSAPVTIGRLPECDVVLADPNVSRYHAEVRPAGSAALVPETLWEVADLGSTNGTKVNGIAVSAPRPLSNGDQITLGSTTIRFEVA